MSLRKKNANPQRQEEEEIPKWSELCPDLLRCVFKRLSFTSLNRAKSVCSSWHFASRGCVPKQNQIPWMILFPVKNNNNDNSRCVLFVPDDKDKVYTSRNLGVEFVKSRCLATCGSWLLMLNPICTTNLYIVNLLTGERINLPDDTNNKSREQFQYYDRACFWIDNKTRDYLVVWMRQSSVFTKKGDNKWQEFAQLEWYIKEFIYNHKDKKLYAYSPSFPIKIWDFSQDHIPRVDGNRFDFSSWLYEEDKKLYWEKFRYWTTRLAVTVSGDVLTVACMLENFKTWRFRIYKMNHVKRKWVEIESLGDEALIYDIGITVVAKDVPGIKRNSIYFCGPNRYRNNRDYIFVFDLTTQKMEPLPKCVFSNIHFFSDARWFFPC